jgi:hypothetical protein
MAITLNGTTGITAPGTETFGSGTALGGATNPIVSMAQGASGYVQSYIINNTNGGSSSADIVAYPSNGSDSHGWVDMGITSLSYNDATYTITGPNESYLFASAPSGSSTTGNLVIATDNTGTANSIQFYTNGFTQAKSAARMTIDSSGNVLVGTTNASATAGAGIKLLTGDNTNNICVVQSASTNANDAYHLYSTGAGAFRFYVDMGGTVHATSIVITAISDERLKENVRDLDTGISTIMALKPRRYDWKEGKGLDKKNAAGFIAQEFETVFPECVGLSKAGEDGIEYKNINYEELIPTLTKAIQEQQALITQLQADVAALKAAK